MEKKVAAYPQLETLQKEAKSLLEKTSLPSPSHESWRKIHLDSVPFVEYLNSVSVVTTGINEAGRQYLVPLEEQMDLLKINLYPEVAGEYYLDVDYFSILNIAYLQSIQVIHIPQNHRQMEIEIYHEGNDGKAFFPVTIIIAERNSEVQILEKFSGKTPSLWGSTVFVVAKEKARVYYSQIRNHTDGDFHFHRIRIFQQADSFVHGSLFHTGGVLGKGFLQARLLQPGCEFRGTGFFLGKKGNYFNMEMDIMHLQNQQRSSLLYKTILTERSHSVFIGKLDSLPRLKGVESQQLNRNLLVSKKAKAESRPWLIVRSEDVHCEHGATSGDLDEEALFYLQLKGLNEEEARKVLMLAFIYDIVQETEWTDDRKQAFLQDLLNRL